MFYLCFSIWGCYLFFFFFFIFTFIWPRERTISIFGHQSLYSFNDWVIHARSRRIVTINVVVVVVAIFVDVTTIAATAITHFTCECVFVQRGRDRWKSKKTNSKKFVCSIHVWDAKLSEMNALQMLVKSKCIAFRMCANARTWARDTSNTLTDSIMCSSSILGLGVCVCVCASERLFHLFSSKMYIQQYFANEKRTTYAVECIRFRIFVVNVGLTQ